MRQDPRSVTASISAASAFAALLFPCVALAQDSGRAPSPAAPIQSTNDASPEHATQSPQSRSFWCRIFFVCGKGSSPDKKGPSSEQPQQINFEVPAGVSEAIPAGFVPSSLTQLAVLDFRVTGAPDGGGSNGLELTASKAFRAAFQLNSTLAPFVSILDQTKIELITKEQGLSATAASDHVTFERVARLAGARYAFLGELNYSDDPNGSWGWLRRYALKPGGSPSGTLKMSLRTMDIASGQIVAISHTEARYRGSNDAKLATSLDAASPQITESIQKLVAQLATNGVFTPSTAAVSQQVGVIATVAGSRATVNRTSGVSAAVGEQLVISRVPRTLADPSSGEKLAATIESVGTAVIVEVNDQTLVIELAVPAVSGDLVLRR